MRRALAGGPELDDDPARIDMHSLYGKLGFQAPGERTIERSARLP